MEREEQENSVYARKRVQMDLDDSELPWGKRPEGISLFGQKSSSYGVSSAGVSSNPYTTKKTPEKPAFGKAFAVQKAASLDYGPGDRVFHIRFGEGTVKNVVDGGKDFEVTGEFDNMGVRKMFASFAKLQKI